DERTTVAETPGRITLPFRRANQTARLHPLPARPATLCNYRCEVSPAPLASPSTDASSASAPSCAASYHEYAYFPSSRSFANFDSFKGWNVSHMTASSWVSCMPIDFSARPGCGPCGRPDGCSVIEPTSTPRRDPNL